jgi:hypothetical protein
MKVSETEMKISGRIQVSFTGTLQRMKATDRKVARMKVTDRKVARIKGADRKVARMKVTDKKLCKNDCDNI